MTVARHISNGLFLLKYGKKRLTAKITVSPIEAIKM